jgi:hypothetical protein
MHRLTFLFFLLCLAGVEKESEGRSAVPEERFPFESMNAPSTLELASATEIMGWTGVVGTSISWAVDKDGKISAPSFPQGYALFV